VPRKTLLEKVLFIQKSRAHDKLKMAEREGFEPSRSATEVIEGKNSCECGQSPSSPTASPKFEYVGSDLEEIVRAWPSLRRELKAAIKAIVESAK